MADLTQTALPSELSSELPGRVGAIGPATRAARATLHRWAQRIDTGSLDLRWPDGIAFHRAGDRPGPAAAIRINHSRFVRRAALGGALGFADSYVDGDWDSPDLAAVLALGLANEAELAPRPVRRMPLATALRRIRHRRNANTKAGSRRNIAAHYDLGNAFYGAWLDSSMTYSSALFSEPDMTLGAAQEAKYARIAEIVGLRPGEHVLEIGCGWGGFAIYAARRFDCRVTALTLSRAQAEWARRAVAAAGLGNQVEIHLQDYRETTGTFNRIVSIEMFEAVGEAFWPQYFDTVRDRLRPGGKAAVQVITIDDARYADYRCKPDFIQLRVFPGGMLPSPQAFAAAANQSGLTITDAFTFGPSYAETLRRWRSRFEAAWPTLETRGFDTEFQRLWRFYLCYCEAGFDAGTVSVAHYALAAD